MTTWLVQREITMGPAMAGGGQELLRDLGPEEGQEWFGIYMVSSSNQKMKIGFSVTEKEARQAGHVIVSKSWMRLKVQGEKKALRTETKILTDLEYKLLNVNFVFSSDTIKFEVLGDVEGDRLKLQIITAAGSNMQYIQLPETPYLAETIMARAAAEGLEKGKTFNIPIFDPTTFGYGTIEIRVVDSKVNEEGKTYWMLTSTFKGIASETWIDTEGRVLMQKMANIMTVRETKKIALNEGWSEDGVQEDIIDTARIKVARKIDNPRQAREAQLLLSGVEFGALQVQGGRQSFDPATGRIQIQRETIDPAASMPLPVDPEPFAEQLKGTATIQVGDPMINRQMREIIGQQTDLLKTAQLIQNWVFENLEKKPLVSIPSARDVLEIKRGDCNEHTALYTALARAAGVPTKILVGVVYQNGAFYYHSWNSVWVGSWVEIDPTFGQFPADATHLRLLEGDLDKQIELLGVIGKLQIDVESVKSD